MDDKILEFYIKDFNYITNPNEIDINYITPVIKRRMSLLDKATFSLLNKTITDNTQYIVFCSQYGEFDRLLKLINQYCEFKEVSPNIFTGSVHNFPVGYFLYNKKKSIPYTALSTFDNTISTGILTSIISSYKHTLFCYCDCNDNNIHGFSFNVVKIPDKNSTKYRIKLKNTKLKDNYTDYTYFFKGKTNKISTYLYEMERT